MCHRSNNCLFVQLWGNTDVKTAFICLFWLHARLSTQFQIIIHRTVKICNQICGIFSFIGDQCANP